MSPRLQKRLAVASAIAAATLFVVGNAHLLTVALRSQPECKALVHAVPARRAC